MYLLASMVASINKAVPHMRQEELLRLRVRLNLQNKTALPTPNLSLTMVRFYEGEVSKKSILKRCMLRFLLE